MSIFLDEWKEEVTVNLKLYYPEMWKLLWQVAFGEYVPTTWEQLPAGMHWLKRRGLVNVNYHSLRLWSCTLTDNGKKQL